jgi:hypothetical protein
MEHHHPAPVALADRQGAAPKAAVLLREVPLVVLQAAVAPVVAVPVVPAAVHPRVAAVLVLVQAVPPWEEAHDEGGPSKAKNPSASRAQPTPCTRRIGTHAGAVGHHVHGLRGHGCR